MQPIPREPQAQAADPLSPSSILVPSRPPGSKSRPAVINKTAPPGNVLVACDSQPVGCDRFTGSSGKHYKLITVTKLEL